MNRKEDIRNYIKQCGRNKVVFCHDSIEGLTYVNVGHDLAMELKNGSKESHFELVRRVVGDSSYDPTIGKYIAIENIDILFEPDLQLNVQSMIDSFSKDQCLIVKTDRDVELGNIPYKTI